MVRRFPVFSSEFELTLDSLPRTGTGPVRWEEIYGEARPLRVEIGVGNSFFLIEVARGAPGFNYLGFEYSRKRTLKFLKKVEATGLTNIRILPENVCLLLEAGFCPGSVDRFYINHPDPWPKRRHAKKRFVSPRNAGTMTRLLCEGGGISLRTDVAAYAVQMLEVLESTEGLVNLAGAGQYAPGARDPYLTAFEKKFLSEGRPIFYLEFEKRAVHGG